MIYLDHINKKEYKSMDKHHPESCPYPDSCIPASWHMDKRGAGCCCGLIHKSTNLDCIRQCIFYEDLDNHEIKLLEHYMTPDEALDFIHSLSLAVRCSFDFNSSYRQYYKVLHKARKNGDKTP